MIIERLIPPPSVDRYYTPVVFGFSCFNVTFVFVSEAAVLGCLVGITRVVILSEVELGWGLFPVRSSCPEVANFHLFGLRTRWTAIWLD